MLYTPHLMMARSPQWDAVRNAHVRANPYCAACGSGLRLNVHHVQPYHLYPELELDPANLLTLCEGTVVNCHLLFGHLRSWLSWNPNVHEDAAAMLAKIKGRPKRVACLEFGPS